MTLPAESQGALEALGKGSSFGRGTFVRNRETSFQMLDTHDVRAVEVARWQDGPFAALSVYVLRGGCTLAGNGEHAHVLAAGQHMLYRVPITTEVTLLPQDGSGFAAVAFQFSDAYLRRHRSEEHTSELQSRPQLLFR